MIYATMIAKVEDEPVLYKVKEDKEPFMRFSVNATSSNTLGKYIYIKMSVLVYANMIPILEKLKIKKGDYVYLNGMYFGIRQGAFYYHNLKLSNICKLKTFAHQEGGTIDGDKFETPFEVENIISSKNVKEEIKNNTATDKDLDF